MRKIFWIIGLYLLLINSSQANINELNTKLLNLENKIDQCLKADNAKTCDQLEIVSTFLIDIMGNEEYAKLLDSKKCDIGSRCAATISRISGKYLKIVNLNLDSLMDLEGLDKFLNNESKDTLSKLSISEKYNLQNQLYSCWSIPIGLSYNDNLNVRVKINLMEDGMVSKIEYLEPEKLSNTSYRLLAESVSRAIRLCEPLKMPKNDYNKWKVTILNFNATDMIGG